MNNNPARKYRSRRQRPCDNCRRRRVCCLRTENEPCSLCQSRGLQCTFLSLPNPKFRPTVTANERDLGSPRRFPDGGEAVGRASSICLGQEKTAETLQYVGLTGDQDPFILQYCRTRRIEGSTGIQWTCHHLGSDPRRPVSFTGVPDLHLEARPRYYPRSPILEMLPSHCDSLVETFFKIVHPALPMLDPRLIQHSTTPSTLLASVFALAHPYCVETQSLDPWEFIDFVSQALPIEARNVKLETIEAALLHAQRHTYIFRAPTMPGLWSDMGSIVGMSYDIGLNVDATNWDIPADQKKRRKRLWWTVYVQEKWTALTLGRPSYINDDQHDVEELQVTDIISAPNALQVTESFPARVFVAAARLTTILADILSRLYTVKATKALQELAAEEVGAIASEFISRLDHWKEELFNPLLGSNTMYDPTGNLQLLYFTAEITLLRALLRTAAGNKFRQRSATLISNVIHWLRNLQVNSLSAFWWMSSRISFAIAGGFMIGMFLSATGEEEGEYWMLQINIYRDLLKAHSVNFNITKLAAIRLDLLLQRDNGDKAEEGVNDMSEPQGLATSDQDEITQSSSTGAVNGALDTVTITGSQQVRDDFPMDPFVAFGNTYGLDWGDNLDLDVLFP